MIPFGQKLINSTLSDTHRGQAVRSRPSFEMYGEVNAPKGGGMHGWMLGNQKTSKIGKSKVG